MVILWYYYGNIMVLYGNIMVLSLGVVRIISVGIAMEKRRKS